MINFSKTFSWNNEYFSVHLQHHSQKGCGAAMMKQLLLTITLTLTGLATQAQSVTSPALQAGKYTCNIRTFGISDGLAATAISGMAQDSRGLMWVATWNGLCCYDGYRFITFPGNNWGDENALSTNRIAMLRVDSKDNLWLRTYDGGIYLFDTRQCRYVNIGLLVEKKYGGHIKPRNIYCLPTGYTWITDETGEMTLRVSDDTPTDINSIEVFGTKGHRYDGNYIRKVQANLQGREWITTDRYMLRYDGNGKFSKVRPEGLESWESNGVDTSLIWRMKACGVSRDDIQKYNIDRQGNLWYSSAYGLTLVNFRQQRMRHLPVVTREQTRSVLCRRDGTVLAGSNDGYLVNVATGERKFIASHIYALFEDSHGRLWIGTKGSGLYVMDSSGNTTHCMPDSTDRYALSHKFVYDFDEDTQGNIWIATYGGGLNVCEATFLNNKERTTGYKFLHSGNDMKGYPLSEFPRVRRITHTADGIMLVSTTTGLLTTDSRKLAAAAFHTTRHNQSDTTSLRTDDVMQVLVTKGGSIYVATQSGGIQTVTSKSLTEESLRMHTVSELNHSAGNVQSMMEDSQGQIWIARETGIERYNPETRQVQQVRIETGGGDGQRVTVITEALPAYGGDGRLWIGTVGGVLTLNTADMTETGYRPNIVFTTVQYQGEQGSVPLLYRKTLEVAPDRRSLTVSFAALDYTENSLMQYAWQMDGETGWNYIHTPHIAFSNLAPGRHRIVVRSTNSDGVWKDNAEVLELVVTPLWWERRWVQLLMLITVIMLSTWAVLTWLRHRRQTREREQRLESILRQYRELQEQMSAPQEVKAQQPSPQQEDAPTTTVRHEYKLSEPQIVNEDEVMMDRLMAFIEQRIDDDGLRIEDMAEAVGMGRTAFYEKIRQIVGVSPSDFLRQVRMQRARQLIVKSTMTFSQIAYAVGFTDPKYFTKCFKKDTGMTPSEYRNNNGQS
jgi:ligand-binding sensor domain-containing protein/AraC-like DNA-binding protein